MTDTCYTAEVEDVYTKDFTLREGSPFATFDEAKSALLDYFWWGYENARDNMTILEFELYAPGIWVAYHEVANSQAFWIKEIAT